VLEAPCDGVVLQVLPTAGSQVVAGEAVVILGGLDAETEPLTSGAAGAAQELEAPELEEAAV
jgi:urea carboxylase